MSFGSRWMLLCRSFAPSWPCTSPSRPMPHAVECDVRDLCSGCDDRVVPSLLRRITIVAGVIVEPSAVELDGRDVGAVFLRRVGISTLSGPVVFFDQRRQISRQVRRHLRFHDLGLHNRVLHRGQLAARHITIIPTCELLHRCAGDLWPRYSSCPSVVS